MPTGLSRETDRLDPAIWKIISVAVRPPYQGAYWCHPHYDRYPQGWEYHEGYWDREEHEQRHGHAYGRYKDRGDDDDQGHGNHQDHD